MVTTEAGVDEVTAGRGGLADLARRRTLLSLGFALATVVLVLRNRRVGHRQATLGEHFAQAWQGLLEGIARFDMLGTEPQAHL